MERTVDILIEISIYSAVITAFILLFRAAFKKRISPKVQYAMWLLLVLRLMLPVTIESGFHVKSLLPERPASVVQEESIFEPTIRRRNPAAIDIDDITYRLEGIERNSHRQDNIEWLEVVAHNLRPILQEEVCILEIAEHAE